MGLLATAVGDELILRGSNSIVRRSFSFLGWASRWVGAGTGGGEGLPTPLLQVLAHSSRGWGLCVALRARESQFEKENDANFLVRNRLW